MDAKVQRELRLLKAYALISTVLFSVLIFVAAKSPSKKPKFEEIDVERINIVEKDGTLRLTISNNDRSPGPVIGGHYMKSREGSRGAGLIFFNDQGDECGGMTWDGKKKDGKILADGGLMFDQFDSDQTVGIRYHQAGDQRSSGLQVWERSLTPMAQFAKQIDEVALMNDGPEKIEATKKLREKFAAANLGTQRVFVGRTEKNDAVVVLMDTKGKPRIMMSVDASNVPTLQFLDETGKVVYSLPQSANK